jgi:hypothetical protein
MSRYITQKEINRINEKIESRKQFIKDGGDEFDPLEGTTCDGNCNDCIEDCLIRNKSV